jgi:arsenate reductase
VSGPFTRSNKTRRNRSATSFNQHVDPSKDYAISAGTQPAEHVHPIVVDVMREVGIDLANAKPQKLTAELAQNAEMLIAIGCGDECPYVPGLRRADRSLPDPEGSPLNEVRTIGDTIRDHVERLVADEELAR